MHFSETLSDSLDLSLNDLGNNLLDQECYLLDVEVVDHFFEDEQPHLLEASLANYRVYGLVDECEMGRVRPVEPIIIRLELCHEHFL